MHIWHVKKYEGHQVTHFVALLTKCPDFYKIQWTRWIYK